MNAPAISDFEKQPSKAYLFDRWVAQRQVPTPLGPFAIQLQINDTDPPDNEMIARASELIQFVDTKGEEVLDIVYGYYLLTAEAPNWLESCNVPRGLGRVAALDCITDRLLVVPRQPNRKEQYRSVVFVDPLWDTEHKLCLDIRDGFIISSARHFGQLHGGSMPARS